jgi:hypothetical protein
VGTIKETYFTIPDGDDPVAQAEGNVLPVGGPGAGIDPGLNFVFLDRLLLSGPQAEVAVGARSQLKFKDTCLRRCLSQILNPYDQQIKR